MPKSSQPADFFVVGGPVQPDRACYVARAADAALMDGIGAQRFTYVLGPRAIGKSSLIGRSVQSLRRSGQLAAVIDLSQIGGRGDGSDPARWYYSIAHRVLRELRLKFDLQSWWQDNAALTSEQRFADFFAELVLAQTNESVTVFFDDIERMQELPFARQFFSALKSCYSRRVSEPEFERLNFVALGVATPAQLCPDPTLSPFPDGRGVELDDFTENEISSLAGGFDVPREQAERMLARIYSWTRGQPYLTQKLARGTVRRGGRPADVERAVNEQFLTSSAAQREPLLAQIRRMLMAPGPGMRQGLACLARVASGADVPDDPAASHRERLKLAGVVIRNADGRLEIRNPIFAHVFDASWARSALPWSWRRPVAIAAAVAAIAALPIWYTQFLPAPYIETLESSGEPLPAIEHAYGRLSSLPGFSGRADGLLTAALSERSRSAQRFGTVNDIDMLLRDLGGHAALADTLMAEYWLRASQRSAHAERRDAALLLAMAARNGQAERAGALGAELIGADYQRLLRTVRLPRTPVWWESDWIREDLTLVDRSHRVDRLDFGIDAAPRWSPAPPPARLTAPQQFPVVRELTVGESGRAGAFDLIISLRHARPSDLLVRLTAPSGVDATVPVPERPAGEQSLRFDAAAGAPLAALGDQERQGLWQISIVDRQSGGTGELLDWALEFGASRTWQERPDEPAALSDPVRTEQVEIELSGDGRIGLAKPTRASASGALAVWDLTDGELVDDFEYRRRPTSIELTADARRLVVASERDLTIWDVRDGTRTAELDTGAEFLLPPAVSVDQSYLAVAERVEAQVPRYHLLSLDDGSLLATVNGVSGVDDWMLGAGAAYLALRGPGRTVRVIDPFAGFTMAELGHQQDVARVLPVPVNDSRIVTVDAAGEIYVWDLGAREAPAVSTHVATTSDPASVSVAREAEALAFVAPGDQVVVRDLTGGFGPNRFRIDGGGAVSTRLAPDASRLWTVNGRVLRFWFVDRTAAAPGPARQLSAVALDRAGNLAAFGYDGGHVRVHDAGNVDALEAPTDGVDYIGHRGSVTALDVSAANGLVASGGSDGVVRIWDLDAGAPSDLFLRHPDGPVHAVAVSPDGRLVASGAEYSARIWRLDGELVGEVPVNGAATAVAFSRDGSAIAIGDRAGNLFFGAPGGAELPRSAGAGAAATAVAYSADGSLLASGDAAGRVRIWDRETADAVGTTLTLQHSISWLGFAGQDTLYVRSGDWVHRVERRGARNELEVTATRLLPLALEGAIAPAIRHDGVLRFLGLWESDSVPRRLDVDFSKPVGELMRDGSTLLGRDWPRVLGLELDPATGTVGELP